MDWLSDSAVSRLRRVLDEADPGETRYELLEEIGRGGMGAVYLARDRQLDRRVALKVLHLSGAGGEAAARLLEEARILARLEHPGIVPVHDAGELPDGRIYYAMKLVEGVRLDQYRETQPPLPELLRLFCRVCEPVAFAHAHGIIHRDLKPQNIMAGKFGEVLVLDWGVAKVGASAPLFPESDAVRAATAHGAVVGTAGFMAPEQAAGASGQADSRSDVYALGKTLEFLLAGRARIPKPLQAILRKATAAEPGGRYSGALDLAADVARFLDGERVLAYRENLAERAVRLVLRNRTMVLLVAAYLVMRILLFLFLRR